MHCPKCGCLIDSEEASFCSKCGQLLNAVRAAMSAGNLTESSHEVRRSGINLGVIMMFVPVVVAGSTVLTTAIGLPAAFALLLAAYIAILLGSDPLLKVFQTAESSVSESSRRARRKEVAFGSSMMFIGTILATCLAASFRSRIGEISLLPLLFTVFALLLFASARLFKSYKELTDGQPANNLGTGAKQPFDLRTGPLDGDLLQLQMPGLQAAHPGMGHVQPRSVTEGTTRHLDSDIDR